MSKDIDAQREIIIDTLLDIKYTVAKLSDEHLTTNNVEKKYHIFNSDTFEYALPMTDVSSGIKSLTVYSDDEPTSVCGIEFLTEINGTTTFNKFLVGVAQDPRQSMYMTSGLNPKQAMVITDSICPHCYELIKQYPKRYGLEFHKKNKRYTMFNINLETLDYE